MKAASTIPHNRTELLLKLKDRRESRLREIS